MLEEITNIINLPIYTTSGAHLGIVDNIEIDVVENKVRSLFVGQPNITLVDGSIPILVPFRWVQSVGDIVILKYFPGRIELTPQEREEILLEERGLGDME